MKTKILLLCLLLLIPSPKANTLNIKAKIGLASTVGLTTVGLLITRHFIKQMKRLTEICKSKQIEPKSLENLIQTHNKYQIAAYITGATTLMLFTTGTIYTIKNWNDKTPQTIPSIETKKPEEISLPQEVWLKLCKISVETQNPESNKPLNTISRDKESEVNSDEEFDDATMIVREGVENGAINFNGFFDSLSREQPHCINREEFAAWFRDLIGDFTDEDVLGIIGNGKRQIRPFNDKQSFWDRAIVLSQQDVGILERLYESVRIKTKQRKRPTYQDLIELFTEN